MEFSRWHNFFVVLIMAAILTAGVSFALKNANYFIQAAAISASQNNGATANQIPLSATPLPPAEPRGVPLANPPQIIKAVYATGYSAGSKSYLNYLSNLFENTQINAVVVDIKGSSGQTKLYNADSLVNFFHSQNIYVIGRIVVFEDPVFAKIRPNLAIYNKAESGNLSDPACPEPCRRVLWKDNGGMLWLDPASKDVWDYNISMAKDAFYHGFDEVNFDYVRFPSDGNESNMGFPISDPKIPMAETINNFFRYARANLAGKISVDLFGQTTVSSNDMGIGQIIENAFENFDYVCPMVYPSHYASGFIGFANPAQHPYEVVKYSIDGAVAKDKINAKLRPWLQDFNMGAVYNADMVEQEIKATQDSLGNNYAGFMLWNPNNIYTQGAVLKPN